MSQMNQFDFYSVTVHSTRKTDLKKMGLKEFHSKRIGNRTYRNGASFPQYEYVAYAGFCDVNSNPDKIAEEWREKCVGKARVRVSYVVRD